MSTKKPWGVGSLSLLLVLAAILWSANIGDVCLGDRVLTAMGLPAWSQGTIGIHYTVMYAFAFLIPAFALRMKWKHDRLALAGRWASLVMMALMALGVLFLAV